MRKRNAKYKVRRWLASHERRIRRQMPAGRSWRGLQPGTKQRLINLFSGIERVTREGAST